MLALKWALLLASSGLSTIALASIYYCVALVKLVWGSLVLTFSSLEPSASRSPTGLMIRCRYRSAFQSVSGVHVVLCKWMSILWMPLEGMQRSMRICRFHFAFWVAFKLFARNSAVVECCCCCSESSTVRLHLISSRLYVHESVCFCRRRRIGSPLGFSL